MSRAAIERQAHAVRIKLPMELAAIGAQRASPPDPSEDDFEAPRDEGLALVNIERQVQMPRGPPAAAAPPPPLGEDEFRGPPYEWGRQ